MQGLDNLLKKGMSSPEQKQQSITLHDDKLKVKLKFYTHTISIYHIWKFALYDHYESGYIFIQVLVTCDSK